MEFEEKARIRLEHWLKHGESHVDEYKIFAAELDSAGKISSAESVREMARLTEQSLASLETALKTLD